jgi:hypothetical protein
MSSAAMLACVRLAAAKVEELHKLLQTELKNADDRAKQVCTGIILHHKHCAHFTLTLAHALILLLLNQLKALACVCISVST